jgi:lysophospholipase L1-like esterase
MDLLKKLLDEHQIKLTLVVYPWPDQIFRRDLNSRQVTVWQDWCRTNEVPFINLFPDFINESDPETTIRSLFITGDVHWNAAGHQRIADGFLQRFMQTYEQAPVN